MKNKYTMRYVVCLFLISILCFSFIGKDYRLKEVNKKEVYNVQTNSGGMWYELSEDGNNISVECDNGTGVLIKSLPVNMITIYDSLEPHVEITYTKNIRPNIVNCILHPIKVYKGEYRYHISDVKLYLPDKGKAPDWQRAIDNLFNKGKSR